MTLAEWVPLYDALLTLYLAAFGVPISVNDCQQFGYEDRDCFAIAWRYQTLARPYREFYDSVIQSDARKLSDRAHVWWLPETIFWMSHYEWCYDVWYQLGISQTAWHDERDRYYALWRLQKMIGPENYRNRFIPVVEIQEGVKNPGLCFRYPQVEG